MKNIPQAYRPSYLWFWPPLIWGGSVISAGTIHNLRRVKVPAHFETPVQFNIELISANTSIIEYWFFSDVEHFFPGIAPLVSILLLLYFKKKKKNNTKNIDDFSLLIQKKKPTANSRYTVNKIVIFIKIFFRDSRFF